MAKVLGIILVWIAISLPIILFFSIGKLSDLKLIDLLNKEKHGS